MIITNNLYVLIYFYSSFIPEISTAYFLKTVFKFLSDKFYYNSKNIPVWLSDLELSVVDYGLKCVNNCTILIKMLGLTVNIYSYSARIQIKTNG